MEHAMELDTPDSMTPIPGDKSNNAAAPDDDSDPIVASYTVLTNAAMPASRKLLMLQYPNKQSVNPRGYRQVSQVRLKPRSGMIEVDVPLQFHGAHDYDRDKGMRWGQMLNRSMNAKSGGSHGLAGGFGVGTAGGRGGGGRRAAAAGDGERDIYDWSEAVRRDQVLRTQTFGGMYKADESEGGETLHLTPATSEIQLRPQLHHIDATTEQDRNRAPKDGPGGVAASSSAGAAPKAITMAMKSESTGETIIETMADRLISVQTESWTKLRYASDLTDEAWHLYEETLLPNSSLIKKAETDDDDAKGKGKASIKTEGGEEEEEEDTSVELKTDWVEDNYLQGIAGKDRVGVLEGYGSTALPGIKAGDIVEEVKTEGGGDVSMSGVPSTKKTTAAKGKGKAVAAPAARKPAAGKGKAVAAGPSR